MAEILLVNPRRRRHKHRRMSALQRKYFGNPRKRHHRHHAKNPHRRRRHHYRHNPLSGLTGRIVPTIKAGAIGAAGGLAVDIIAGYVNPQLNTMLGGTLSANPAFTALTKLLYAVGIGLLGGKILRGQGNALAVGAATVAIHDFAKVELIAAMPTLPLGFVSYGPVVSGVPATMQATQASTYRPVGRMGKYMRGPQRGVGQYLTGLGDTEFANGIPTG